jgi:acetyl-CoA carboxylase carboxyltransferase component
MAMKEENPKRTLDLKIEELEALRSEARLAGGEQAIAKQHDRGKLTARERIEHLLDKSRTSARCPTPW